MRIIAIGQLAIFKWTRHKAHGRRTDVKIHWTKGATQPVCTEYLNETCQGLALTVKELRGDLTAVSRGCDALVEQALPNLGTATWPQTDQPCPAVIADQLDHELAAEKHCELCGNWMPADELDAHMDRHDAETAAPKAAAPKAATS